MNSETMTCTLHEEFTVRLKSTPATGYAWELPALPESVELLRAEFENLPGDTLPGGPVMQVFHLRTLDFGEYKMLFALKRKWESGTIETHEVTVLTHKS